MAVFRVERTKDYTVMSNYHLRDRNLSCKACGLLSKMLSLPDEWDYTTRGLAAICKDGVDAIGSALKELEKCGYLVRNRLRDAKGRITDTEYIIYERPHLPPPDTALPNPAPPDTGNPDMDTPCTENPAQLNTKQSNTKKSITHASNTHSFLPSEEARTEGWTDGFAVRERIQNQISYDFLLLNHGERETQIDELVELMTEVELNQSPSIRLGREEYPTSYVRGRFRQITAEHIEKILFGIQENTTWVRNTKAYLLSALFNAVSTIDNHYAMRINHDLYGGC